jgi:hypothetical protein
MLMGIFFVALVAPLLPAGASRPEACFAVNPGLPIAGSTCGYGPATVRGGIDAVGSWIVTIERPVLHGHRHKARTRTIVITSGRLAPQCVQTGPRTICPVGTIQPGDTVTAEATDPISFVGIGNPCPVPNPGAPPPIAGGEC